MRWEEKGGEGTGEGRGEKERGGEEREKRTFQDMPVIQVAS